jgi:hypothetical protein
MMEAGNRSLDFPVFPGIDIAEKIVPQWLVFM